MGTDITSVTAKRRLAEQALQTLALAAFLAALAILLMRPSGGQETVVVGASDMTDAVERSSLSPPTAFRVNLDTLPAAAERDWLAAIARQGTPVAWRSVGSALPATAITAEPVADPHAITRIHAAFSGGPVALLEAVPSRNGEAVSQPAVLARLPEGEAGGRSWRFRPPTMRRSKCARRPRPPARRFSTIWN